MANVYYFLGDIASRPLNWDWANKEALSGTAEWLTHVNYSIYNWLMLRSVKHDDVYGAGVWGPCKEDD